MKTWWLALIIVLSLMGLMVVQLQLLYKGMISEKASFDREMNIALMKAGLYLEDIDTLRAEVLSLQQANRTREAGQNVIPSDYLMHHMDSLFATIIEEMAAEPAWGLTESYLNYPLASSKHFQAGGVSGYRSYTYRLEGIIREECQCDLFLQMQIDGVLGIIVRRLYSLIIPSAAFVLMMLLCLLLIVRSFRQQRKLMTVKNDFINNLAHELKTPVFSMSLLSRLLKASISSGDGLKSTHYLQLMEAENNAMKEHVEKVLELAEFQGSRYELQREPVEINTLLEKTVEAFQYRAKEAEGSLLYHCEFEEDSEWLVDRIHFKNAVQNLLDNALKYGGTPPQVTLRVYEHRRNGIIEVEDNGKGISSGEQKKVFRKFYRSRPAGAGKVKGFGIGLNYTREVIRAHKGKVWVKSKVGEGSTFFISIPLKT